MPVRVSGHGLVGLILDKPLHDEAPRIPTCPVICGKHGSLISLCLVWNTCNDVGQLREQHKEPPRPWCSGSNNEDSESNLTDAAPTRKEKCCVEQETQRGEKGAAALIKWGF